MKDEVPADFRVRCRKHEHDILWYDAKRIETRVGKVMVEIEWECREETSHDYDV